MYYGMFTDAGNGAIQGIIVTAKNLNMSWDDVYKQLVSLAKIEGFGEATDTMVREMVYDALEFNTDFYI